MENPNKSLEELKKEFIVNKEEYSKQRLPNFIQRTLKYCKVNSESGIHIENFALTIRDRIAIALTARFLANQLEPSIKAEMSGEELSTFLDVDKPVVYARLKDLSDVKMIQRLEKGTYQIIPYSIESLLDELDAKYQIVQVASTSKIDTEKNTKEKISRKQYSKAQDIVVDENFQKKVIDKIDKSKYSYVYELPTFDIKTLAVLFMAKEDCNQDGLTSPEIISVLSEKFRIKTAWPTISNALKRLDQKAYVDSKSAGNHSTKRVYKIMAEGENYLKSGIENLKASK